MFCNLSQDATEKRIAAGKDNVVAALFNFRDKADLDPLDEHLLKGFYVSKKTELEHA